MSSAINTSLSNTVTQLRNREIPLAMLASRPFELVRDTRCYYPAEGHEQAYAAMNYLFQERNLGMGQLTGDAGTGKTLIRTLLFNRLDPQRYVRVSIENSLLDFDGLLLEIISQIRRVRVTSQELADRYSRLSTFKQLLRTHVESNGKHLAIFIDEAQDMDVTTLKNLTALTNISMEHQQLLTIAFFASADIGAITSHIPGIDQRIAIKERLASLSRQAQDDYVAHRLKLSGWDQPLPFSTEILDHMYETAKGNPRIINVIFNHAIKCAQDNAQGLDNICLDHAINLYTHNRSGHETAGMLL